MNQVQVTGEMMIGWRPTRGRGVELRAFDPQREVELEPSFAAADVAMVDMACKLAEAAFDPFRNTALETRARFLECIAENIMNLGDALIDRSHAETALPRARLEGERGRTVGQLRLFASMVREGRWLSATIDSAQPERKPQPRPALRLQNVPVGPVAVFGASNFPLAFSVAGGDTASALAAGCPVVVKAHPAHLGTSELVSRAVRQAGVECALPEGVFSMLIGVGNETGEALVAHPAIKAVGFTGSRQGGLALMRIAAARKGPIPVHAEMSSINPLFVLPGALARRSMEIAQNLADSVDLGAGQFCTNPGLVVVIDSEEARAFVAQTARALADKAAQTMLTPDISATYARSLRRRMQARGVDVLIADEQQHARHQAQPALFAVSEADFLADPELENEIFGPASLVVYCADEQGVIGIAEHLEGQLTCTLQIEMEDWLLAAKLFPVLERKAGRILANGFPTGVEVCNAMVHGGPFPATSDSRGTSVGANAIYRFLRPVCYQNFPTELLPLSLQDDNPLALCRFVDGQMTGTN